MTESATHQLQHASHQHRTTVTVCCEAVLFHHWKTMHVPRKILHPTSAESHTRTSSIVIITISSTLPVDERTRHSTTRRIRKCENAGVSTSSQFYSPIYTYQIVQPELPLMSTGTHAVPFCLVFYLKVQRLMRRYTVPNVYILLLFCCIGEGG